MNDTNAYIGTVSREDMQRLASGETTLQELDGKTTLTHEQVNEIADLFNEVIAAVTDLQNHLKELNIV